MSGRLTVIWWRDIPAQVTASRGRTKVRAELPKRFAVAIDRAAMIAGLTGTDEYLGEWRHESSPCGDDLEAIVSDEIRRLEESHPPSRLNALAANGGVKPDQEQDTA